MPARSRRKRDLKKCGFACSMESALDFGHNRGLNWWLAVAVGGVGLWFEWAYRQTRARKERRAQPDRQRPTAPAGLLWRGSGSKATKRSRSHRASVAAAAQSPGIHPEDRP